MEELVRRPNGVAYRATACDDAPMSADHVGRRTSRHRHTAFRVIAWIMAVSAVAFGIFTAGTGIVVEDMEIHAFHNVVVASLLLVISAPAALAAARHLDHPLPGLSQLAAIGVAGLATMALSLTLDPFTLPFIVLGGVLWVSWLRRPERDPFPRERPSAMLLVLVLAAAVPLTMWALDNAELQRIDDVSQHAELFHWVETSFYAVAVLLLGLLAAMRPTAFRTSAWSAGVGLAIVGGASLALQDYPSALGSPWAAIALAGGVAFVVAAEWEGGRMAPMRTSVAGDLPAAHDGSSSGRLSAP
jgi:hypothetical protein